MSFLNPFRASSNSKAKGTAGSPLELISYDVNTGRFSLGKEALNVLRSVSCPNPSCLKSVFVCQS